MRINRLKVSNIRNLKDVSVTPHPNLNIVIGDNGAGKTSLLEAIYLLAFGRSFRTHRVKKLISDGASRASVFADLFDPQNGEKSQHHAVGIEKNLEGYTELRWNGERVKTISSVSKFLPIQLLAPDLENLIEGDTKIKRQFLDWGVFHVKHPFLDNWKTYSRLLKQRNQALRQASSVSDASFAVSVWDKQIGQCATLIHRARNSYFTDLEQIFKTYREAHGVSDEVNLRYAKGWQGDPDGLEKALKESLASDFNLGYTSRGPHRASVNTLIDGRPAKDILSRGQKKNLLFCLTAAQIYTVRRVNGKQCLLLLDDLAAEIDKTHLHRILTMVGSHDSQAFITATSEEPIIELIKDFSRDDHAQLFKVFHVKHGSVMEYG